MLCECGFNQQLFEGKSEARGNGTSVREIAWFSSLPQVVVSCSWDSCHVYVELTGEGARKPPGGKTEERGSSEGAEGSRTKERVRGETEGEGLEEKQTACDKVKIGSGEEEKTMTFTTGRWKVLDGLQAELNGEKVMEVMEIGNRNFVKTNSGRYLGVGEDKHVHIPQDFALVEKMYTSQGGVAAYARLTDGLVYACSNTSLDLTTPILPGVPVKQVACGSDHVLLLGKSGRVWSGGLNHRGQLGHGDIHPRPHPSLIEALDGICFEAISCGNWHNLALSGYGDVYSWGWNVDQQLGHSADTATVATPTLVDVEEEGVNFKSMQCGARHSAALSVGGVLYTWGWNMYGQLGPRTPLSRARPAPITKGVISWVHCSPWSTLFLVHNK